MQTGGRPLGLRVITNSASEHNVSSFPIYPRTFSPFRSQEKPRLIEGREVWGHTEISDFRRLQEAPFHNPVIFMFLSLLNLRQNLVKRFWLTTSHLRRYQSKLGITTYGNGEKYLLYSTTIFLSMVFFRYVCSLFTHTLFVALPLSALSPCIFPSSSLPLSFPLSLISLCPTPILSLFSLFLVFFSPPSLCPSLSVRPSLSPFLSNPVSFHSHSSSLLVLSVVQLCVSTYSLLVCVYGFDSLFRLRYGGPSESFLHIPSNLSLYIWTRRVRPVRVERDSDTNLSLPVSRWREEDAHKNFPWSTRHHLL